MGEPAEFERADVPRAKTTAPQAPAPAPRRQPQRQANEATNVHARIQAVMETGTRLRMLIVSDNHDITGGMTGLVEGVYHSEFVVESAAGGYVIAMTGDTDALAAEVMDSHAVINPTAERRAWLVEDARLRTIERHRGRRNP